MKYTYKLLILVACFVLMFSVVSIAKSYRTPFSVLSTESSLYTTQESSLELLKSFEGEKVLGILLTDGNGRMVAAEFKFVGNVLHVNPSEDLVAGKEYEIRIFTESRKYQINIKAEDYISIDNNRNSIIKIAANPDKGFNYPYYLLVPQGALTNTNKKYMVVEPNNSGTPSDSLEFHEVAVKIHLHDYGYTTGGAGGYQVATELKTPLLIPAFPRPRTEDGAGIYTHALDREAMTVKDVAYERVDLQLKAMIEDAQKLLNNEGIKLEKKVFMVGFSASGDFVNRFMFLYPEMVKAIASSSSTIFPAAEYEGVALNYPLGIADIEDFTGARFNAEEYAKIPKYIYRGEHDGNDVTADWDKNGDWYVQAVRKLFGDERYPEKWFKKIRMIEEMGFGDNYQYHIYKDIGHNITEKMYEDIVSFFKANIGDKFVKITPHESAN
ncbi:MAG TPA: hypothetical protein GXX49_11690 [Clostridiaceae bacterium]|nr:hypothetical protein [Clostridiaceae bacterium]